MSAKNSSNKKAVLRQKLFDLYANNWNIVKQHPNLRVTPDINDVFICPLCFRCFTREYLDSDVLLSFE